MTEKLEILAPAGSPEMLRAAVLAGADAVYLGLSELNARRGAENFNEQTLHEATKFSAERGVKVYLTLNSLLFQREVDTAERCIRLAAAAGVNGVLVGELGMAGLVRACAPDMPMHASTQLSIHSPAGAKALYEMGFSRVVLARELSAAEIQKIHEACPIELEVFVHGALCMSVSGQCLLSAVAGGRSGNRGLCAGPCRQGVSSAAGGEISLSLKDMSLLTPGHLKKLAEMGVKSLKIEGRLKRPEYVVAAVRAARQARGGEQPDMKQLSGVFSRGGHTDGYFTGSINSGMFGVRTKEDVLASAEAQREIAREMDRDEALVPVKMVLEAALGAPMRLTISDFNGNEATVYGASPEAAVNRETSAGEVRAQLIKLGGTPYTALELSVDIKSGLFMRLSEINSIRREAVLALSAERRPKAVPFFPFLGRMASSHPDFEPEAIPIKPAIRLVLRTREQLTNEVLAAADEVALAPGELLALPRSGGFEGFTGKLMALQPPVAFDEESLCKSLLELKAFGVSKLLAQGISGITLGRELGFSLFGGELLNVTNSLAIAEYRRLGIKGLTLSPELSAGAINSIGESTKALSGSVPPLGIFAYGRLPLMTLRVCPIKAAVGCGRCRAGENYIVDRTGRRFPLSCGGEIARLLNCDITYLADKLLEFKGLSFLTLSFFEESAGEIVDIINEYRRGGRREMTGLTRGLYFRKVL